MTDVKTIGEMTDKELATAVRNFAHQTTINKVKTFPIRAQDFPINAIERHWNHGVQRLYNDVGAVGGENKFATVDDKIAHVEAMIEDHKKGIVHRARTGAAGVDPVTVRARQNVRKVFKAALAAAGKKDVLTKFNKAERDEQFAKLDELIKAEWNGINWMQDAKKQLDREQKAVAEVDASELDF